MDPDACLDDFLSRDPHRIWQASGAVRSSWDRPALRALAARAGKIRAATQRIELGGGFYPNRQHLAFALRKLAFVQDGGGCFYALYPEDIFYVPAHEASLGRVTVEETRDVPADYAVHHRVRGLACGARCAVEEQDGCHYPVHRWSRMANGRAWRSLFSGRSRRRPGAGSEGGVDVAPGRRRSPAYATLIHL